MSYPKKNLLPPKRGPLPQGLKVKYNTDTNNSEKLNGRRQYRQSTSKRSTTTN